MTTYTYYTYDRSHRLTSQYILGGEAHYYSYNERDMVTGIQDVGGPGDFMRYFTYNGVGERVIAVDNTASPGLPAYFSYDGRKLLQDKQKTTLGLKTTNYRHNSSSQDCPLGSMVEVGFSDRTSGYPTLDGAGNLVTVQDPSAGSNDSFVANWFTEQIAATDNFKTRPRALTPSGEIRGQTSQEVYYLNTGETWLPSKGLVLGPAGGVLIDPAKKFLWLKGLLLQQNGVGLCQQVAGGEDDDPHVYHRTHRCGPTPAASPGPGREWRRTRWPECWYTAPLIYGTDERPCCGPDVTDPFSESLSRLAVMAENLGYIAQSGAFNDPTWTYRGRLMDLFTMGTTPIDYKFTNYVTDDCPRGTSCNKTVTLCGNLCINDSILGWIGGGFVSELLGFDLQETNAYTLGAKLGRAYVPGAQKITSSTELPADVAGNSVGFTLGQAYSNRLIVEHGVQHFPVSAVKVNPQELCIMIDKVWQSGLAWNAMRLSAPNECSPCKTKMESSAFPYLLTPEGKVDNSRWAKR